MILKVPKCCPLCGETRLIVEWGNEICQRYKNGKYLRTERTRTGKVLCCIKCGSIGSSEIASNKLDLDKKYIENEHQTQVFLREFAKQGEKKEAIKAARGEKE